MRMRTPLTHTSVWPENRLSLVPMGRLFSDFEQMFEDPAPHMSFAEAEEGFFVTFDMPGVKKEDISIETLDGTLRITAERKNTLNISKAEAGAGNQKLFHSVRLPLAGDVAKLKALHEDGVLTVAIPKAEAAKPRKIAIESEAGGLAKLLSVFKKPSDQTQNA